MPDFSSFFIGRQKINYNFLVIFFFSIGRQFWGFGNRPMIGRRSADDWPISRPMSYLNEPHFIGRCVGRPSADHRPTIGRSSLAPLIIGRCVGRPSADNRPIVKFWDCFTYRRILVPRTLPVPINYLYTANRQIKFIYLYLFSFLTHFCIHNSIRKQNSSSSMSYKNFDFSACTKWS